MPNPLLKFAETNPNTVSALIQKRAEISGQLEESEAQSRRLAASLRHIDEVIRLFAPTMAPDSIVPRRQQRQDKAKPGEMTRIVLKAIREAGRPITSEDIAIKIMGAHGISTDDRVIHSDLIRRVRGCLHHHRKRGLVRQIEQPGRFQGWEIVGIESRNRSEPLVSE